MIIITNDLVKQWKPLIYKLLGERGRKYTPEEMNDLFVDTVVEMMVNARYYDGKYAVGTWISLQVNSALNKFTHKEAGSPLSNSITSEIPEPEEYVEDESDVETLKEQIEPFLRYLDDAEREVFVDRVWDGLPVTEIAERRHMHKKSVSRMLSRITKKLQLIIHGGTRVSPYSEVHTDAPLEHAIKVMDDAHYHTYRMAHFEGLPLVAISKVNGMSIDRNLQLLSEAEQFVFEEWGVRA